ncbi:P-loop containing nucleoside triphosphate hydrolase protein [Mycena leptocephala]|nr:P-loop containing nucleoside triphosphate hydrolase protein [Mycena leptocephala]
MLPSQPKIFHGRDSELSDILHLFSQGTPRIAVLGTGGMGKTSLAKAVIHHTEITERYNQHRFFVACDSAATQVELAALIGAHVGLKPGKDLTHPVIQYFSSSSDSLLILDNLETLWEPAESQGKIEEFLSLLTGVAHLALLITMRGAERPTKVAWTHPFLPLLKPLEQAAARQTFIDIADNTHDPKEVDKVLSLTDNMPLAISLIAHLADSEGCSHVLSHWEEEKTSLISDGYDRTSNLDLSISLSLSSPRLNPHSKDLLSLLSMLPDGLSDVELVQSKLPIDNILGCKAALICTTLAYSDEHKWLKALVPIREYMQKIQPPDDHLIHPLLKHFQELLEFYMEYQGNESSSSTVARLSSNYSNIHKCPPEWVATSRIMGQGAISLIQQIQNVLPHPHDHRLEAYFILECLNSRIYSISNLKTLASDALEHFKEFDDPDLKSAISLALSTGNTKWHSHGLHNLAWVEWALGDYSAAQMHANEAQRLALISADLHREALALDIEASCCRALGNYTQAMSLCLRARDLLGLCAMSGGTLDHNIMNTQAEVHKCKSEYVEARSIHNSILEETSIQDLYNYSFALLNVAEIDVMLGAPKDDVQRDCDRARKMLDTLGDVAGVILSPPEGGEFTGSKDNPCEVSKIALEGFTEMDVHCSRAECMLRLRDISMGHGNLLKAVEFWDGARPLFERSSQAKQVQHINERAANISKDVLQQHRNNLAHLAELNALAGTVEELEDDLSDNEDLDKMDMVNGKELGLIAA